MFALMERLVLLVNLDMLNKAQLASVLLVNFWMVLSAEVCKLYSTESLILLDCIVGCDTCSDDSTCTTCNAAFVKQGSTCVCPTAQYLGGSNCQSKASPFIK